MKALHEVGPTLPEWVILVAMGILSVDRGYAFTYNTRTWEMRYGLEYMGPNRMHMVDARLRTTYELRARQLTNERAWHLRPLALERITVI